MSAASRLLMALCVIGGAQLRAGDGSLAEQAQVILAQHCHQCHGRAGSAKGGLGFILDRDQLVARGLIVPGKPDASELHRRVLVGDMPPAGKPPVPAPALKTLRDWIASGAPALPRPPRSPLPPTRVVQLIEEDLRGFTPSQRRFLRYATFAHLHEANRPDAELETASQALSKLLNSLSWHPRVARPSGIDPGRTILRIDLRDYRWTARTWDRLASVYPYRAPDPSAPARACAEMTGTEAFALRGDWLVATASRGKLYYDLLEMPATDRGLERLLQLDVARSFREETVVRAGFNGSGVSRNNRVIERHDAAYGAYWRSHDFSDNTNRQNIFENPLGPVAGRHSFRPAGGEIIFHLPNGMQGFLIVDAAGQRVEKAPVEIVSDPNRPDRQVEVGISCMNCHGKGLIPKEDQIRGHVEKNAPTFPVEVLEQVRAIYPPPRRFRFLMEGDTKRYQDALRTAGVSPEEPDPLSPLTLRYEGTLDLTLAAAELGLKSEELTAQLKASPALQRLLGPLQARGTLQRQVFEENYAQLIANVRPAWVVEKRQEVRPAALAQAFVGHTDTITCLALSQDGRLALSGSQDHTLRLWEVPTGKHLLTLEGHSAGVSGVALSPDGARALSCGLDRSVRLWDLRSGKEIGQLRGHLDRVRTVAFSPDGTRALTGSQDRTIRLWDIRQQKTLQILRGHEGPIHCVCFSPDGNRALSGGADGYVRLWDLKSGKERFTQLGHRRGVSCLAFSPKGDRVISGGEDRLLRVWDGSTGKAIRVLSGLAQAPLSVRFSPDGKRVLAVSGLNGTEEPFLKVWESDSGKELWSRSENGSVWCAAFTPDGEGALTGGTDRRLLRWIVDLSGR